MSLEISVNQPPEPVENRQRTGPVSPLPFCGCLASWSANVVVTVLVAAGVIAFGSIPIAGQVALVAGLVIWGLVNLYATYRVAKSEREPIHPKALSPPPPRKELEFVISRKPQNLPPFPSDFAQLHRQVAGQRENGSQVPDGMQKLADWSGFFPLSHRIVPEDDEENGSLCCLSEKSRLSTISEGTERSVSEVPDEEINSPRKSVANSEADGLSVAGNEEEEEFVLPDVVEPHPATREELLKRIDALLERVKRLREQRL